MSIISFFTELLANNKLAQAAIVAAPMTALAYSAKALPMQMFNFCKRLVSIDIRFNSAMMDYPTVSRWVSENVVSDKFSRNFNYQIAAKWDPDKNTETVRHRGLTVGYGNHIGFYKNRLVRVSRFLEENNQMSDFKEHLTVTFFAFSKKIAQEFANDIAAVTGNNSTEFNGVPVFTNYTSGWNRSGKLPLRRMSSVFSANDAGDKLVQTIRDFEAKRDENHRLGLPHHMGIMLHGPPGGGKSSLIHAVATELERSIYYLNLGSVEKDRDLTELISGRVDWSEIILSIEDIDATSVKVDRKTEDGTTESPVSLSALLNVLDGILCPDGLVVIATTNHYERLDPALRRPGRFDHTIELQKLGYDDFVRMADLFGKPMSMFDVANDVEMTGAEMRAMIMEAA